jgi:hypothetical protein
MGLTCENASKCNVSCYHKTDHKIESNCDTKPSDRLNDYCPIIGSLCRENNIKTQKQER